MAKKQKRVIRYKSYTRINPGIIIFGIIFIYIAISLFKYITTDRINYYEVVEGTSSDETYKSYKGIALRKESVVNADSSGYVDYYVREGARISLNTTLYSMDADGTINKLLSEMSEKDTTLTDDDITKLKDKIYTFTNNYDDMDFNEVYNFKNNVQGTVADLINMNALDSLIKNNSDSQFSINKARNTGIVLYRFDGYENKKAKELTMDDFRAKNYSSQLVNSGDYVEANDPIYKSITDDEWSIVVPFTKNEVKKYKDTVGVKIKFNKDNITTTANIKIVKGADGKKYGVITLAKYVVRYATDRFVNIQIIDNITTGLKIPKISIASKNLYIIPKDYATKSNDDTDIGFRKQFVKDGKIDSDVTYPTISYSDDDNYYVSTDEFEKGDVLIKDDSVDTYTIGAEQTRQGVYNINNGYTVFVQVTILGETDEYYIVESGEKYGLSVYDHIVLDSSKVKENQIIFQ